jgi:DNA-binding MarR family transcriptional regulator
MRTTTQSRALQRQVHTVRNFNRYYTMRLGLLRGRYLNSEFSLTEARILYELAQGPEITAASLRRTLSLDAGYISRLLASFEKRGLLQTKPSRLDRRAVLLKLTVSGERTAARLNGQAFREMEALLQNVPRNVSPSPGVSAESSRFSRLPNMRAIKSLPQKSYALPYHTRQTPADSWTSTITKLTSNIGTRPSPYTNS